MSHSDINLQSHIHTRRKSYPKAIKRPTVTCLLEVEIKKKKHRKRIIENTKSTRQNGEKEK